MSRGDQRERDRAKAQQKAAQKAKQQGREGNPLKRNEDDAAALQAKIAAKKAAAQNTSDTGSTKGPVPRKKVQSKSATVDDLLSVGLSAGKKGKIGAK